MLDFPPEPNCQTLHGQDAYLSACGQWRLSHSPGYCWYAHRLIAGQWRWAALSGSRESIVVKANRIAAFGQPLSGRNGKLAAKIKALVEAD